MFISPSTPHQAMATPVHFKAKWFKLYFQDICCAQLLTFSHSTDAFFNHWKGGGEDQEAIICMMFCENYFMQTVQASFGCRRYSLAFSSGAHSDDYPSYFNMFPGWLKLFC